MLRKLQTFVTCVEQHISTLSDDNQEVFPAHNMQAPNVKGISKSEVNVFFLK